MSGSPSACSHGALVVVPALRVVVGHRADERELHLGEAALHLPVGVDHAERVLPRIEPRDLGEERALDVDAELVDDVRRVLGRQRHVLRHQRIDRRWPDDRHLQVRMRHVLAHVEDRRVVALDRRQQHVEDLLVRGREVDVAAPDPPRAPLREGVDHRDGLRVVDDHVVVVRLRELARVLRVEAGEDRLVLLAQRALRALQAVVDRLRDLEELVLAVDDPPLDVESRIGHQRHEGVVDLGDAAAERRRRHMRDALALQRLGQPLDLVHQTA